MRDDPPPPAVVLDRPQLAENIGAVARVMANFGLDDLRLVAPRGGWPQRRAWTICSGAHWPLDGARVYACVREAIADRRLVLAATARPRELRLPVLTPRQAAAELAHAAGQGLDQGAPTALLFGSERAGLETADIALCQAVVTIPIDPRFASLNLAQAVNVLAYEWRLTVLDAPPPAFGPAELPAEAAALHGLYDHLERELQAAGFFHPPEAKPAMVRNLRAALGRARLTDGEVRAFRGVIATLAKRRKRSPRSPD